MTPVEPAVDPPVVAPMMDEDDGPESVDSDGTISDDHSDDDGGEGEGTVMGEECGTCGEKRSQDEVVVCDECKCVYHIYCVQPALDHVTEEEVS